MGGLCSVKGSVGLKVFPVCLVTLARDIRHQTLFSMGGLCSVKGMAGLKVSIKVSSVCLVTLAVDVRRHFSVWEDYVLLKGGWVAKACIKVSGHLQWISVVTFLPSTHALVYCW